MVSPPPATDAEIETVHDPEYVAVVRHVGRALVPAIWFGLGTDDDPVFEGMHEAAALVVGATLAAARSVWSMLGKRDGVERHFHEYVDGRWVARG